MQATDIRTVRTVRRDEVTWELRGFKVCSYEGKDDRTDVRTAAAGDPPALRQQSQRIIPALISQDGRIKNEASWGFMWKPQLTLTQQGPRPFKTEPA